MKRPKMMLALLEGKKDGQDINLTNATRRKVNAPSKSDEKIRHAPADLFAYQLFSKEITNKIDEYVD